MYVCLTCSSNGEESAYNAGDPGSILGLGRSSGEGNGNPLQYSCLENPMDRESWQATVPGIPKSWTQLTLLSRLNSISQKSPSFATAEVPVERLAWQDL